MKRKAMFLWMPALLIVTTSLVFYTAALFLGPNAGYLAGFVFYWLFWCLAVPVLILKKKPSALAGWGKPLFVRKNRWVALLFLSTLVLPVFMYFIPKWTVTPLPVFLLGIPLAVVHGFFEELFWRGLYVNEFPRSIVWGILIPSAFFTLWHLAPGFATGGTSPLFLISTVPLGVTYAITAYVTKSARWSIIGHGISGILAYSGLLSLSLYNLFG